MMPVVRIDDATFKDLKSVSTWIRTGTPSETIAELVREKMDALGLERDVDELAVPEVEQGDSASNELPVVTEFKETPGLTFTKIERAKVEGQKFNKINWAGLLAQVIRELKNKGFSGETLERAIEIPAKSGEYLEEGYKFYPDLEISIQGQSAQDAWKEIKRIADRHSLDVEVQFRWRDNTKAQHPGKVGVLRVAN